MRFSWFLAIALVACGAQLPAVIRDEAQTTARAKPGAATIVFFTDFQCPFCRKTRKALAPIAEAHRDRLRVVLRHVPLPRHPDARTAARAAVCVEKLTPELLTDYAHALFEAPDLSEQACEALAIERGVKPEAYRRCVVDPATDARIEGDVAMYESVQGDGVPLMFVGSARLEGAQSAAELEAAITAAIEAAR